MTGRSSALELVRVFLNELGLKSFLKTSGGKGLHVVVPLKRLRDWDTVKDFSEAIVVHLAKTIPQRFVAKSGPSNRRGKIFIDYLRNGFGATTVCPWSVRARPGLRVSVPLAAFLVEHLDNFVTGETSGKPFKRVLLYGWSTNLFSASLDTPSETRKFLNNWYHWPEVILALVVQREPY